MCDLAAKLEGNISRSLGCPPGVSDSRLLLWKGASTDAEGIVGRPLLWRIALCVVLTGIDDSFGVSFDLRVEPALRTCCCFILKEPLCCLEKKFRPYRRGFRILPSEHRQASEASPLLVKGQRINVLMVSDGAGTRGKCVKLAFLSRGHSATPCCDLSASFSPPLLTPQSFRGLAALTHDTLVPVSLSSTVSTDWRCEPPHPPLLSVNHSSFLDHSLTWTSGLCLLVLIEFSMIAGCSENKSSDTHPKSHPWRDNKHTCIDELVPSKGGHEDLICWYVLSFVALEVSILSNRLW